MMRFQTAYSTPPVVKNLIILNGLFFLAEIVLPGRMGDWLIERLGLFFWESGNFQIYQLVTSMFLHANFEHIFFNMFALWMFGRTLEYELGSQRFLTFYMVCGVGAALIQYLTALAFGELPLMLVGASGAVRGLLLAFGVMHPNAVIMLLIPPIPMKAKYFVVGYAAIELISAYTSTDNVAHFAHLGGMLFGWLLLRYWRSKSRNPYTPGGWQRWEDVRQKPSMTERLRNAVGRKHTEETGNAHHTCLLYTSPSPRD